MVEDIVLVLLASVDMYSGNGVIVLSCIQLNSQSCTYDTLTKTRTPLNARTTVVCGYVLSLLTFNLLVRTYVCMYVPCTVSCNETYVSIRTYTGQPNNYGPLRNDLCRGRLFY